MEGTQTARRNGFWRVILIGLCLITIYGILKAAAQTYDVFLLGFLAILIGVMFSFPVNFLSRWISRGWATLATLILVLAALAGVGFTAAPIVSQQASQLATQAPIALDRAQKWFSKIERRAELSQGGEQKGEQKNEAPLGQEVRGILENVLPKTLPVAAGFATLVSTFLLLLILAAFFVSQPESYRVSFSYLVPREQEPVLNEAWKRLGTGLRHWVGGILVSMTIMGTFTALGLWLAGIQGWFTLGCLTFIGTFVPYLGALSSAIPGLIIGLSQSSTHFLYALLVYTGVHILEGYIVEPFVMKRAVSLHPGILLFWQALMAGVFGVLGIVIATPLLVCLKVLVGYFYIERKLGKDGPKP